MNRRCYILGAGFSKPCGLPLARELTQQVIRHMRSEESPGLRDVIKPLLNGWTDFLRKVYPSIDFKSEWPDFEDAITLLDEWELYRADFEGTPTPDGPLQPAHLKSVLLQHLGQLLCQLISACTQESLEPVHRFLKSVVSSGDTIVSFNWDLLIEAAAADLHLPVSYGGEIKGVLEMAKPHGSLNLAPVPRKDYEEWHERAVNVRALTVDYEYEEHIVVRADDPRDAANRIIHPFKDTMLVEPNTRKQYKSPWLKLQWKRAFEMVRTADEIVVIGFSLPDTDYRPRILFQLAGFDRDPAPKLRLVSPSAQAVAQRFQKIVKARVEVEAKPWFGWLEGERAVEE